MTESKRTEHIGKVADFLKEAKPRHVPKVKEQAGVSELIEAFVQSDHSRIVYVVDEQERLKGIISLGNLVRHFFFHYHDTHIDSRHLISMAVSETAKDFMHENVLVARVTDDVEDVLKRMIKNNVKEIAILDSEKRVIADLTIIDLLKYYKHHMGKELI
jgi:CBS domain-containing protein